jgi:hypothetical protein
MVKPGAGAGVGTLKVPPNNYKSEIKNNLRHLLNGAETIARIAADPALKVPV